jgi:hypothetical protein
LLSLVGFQLCEFCCIFAGRNFLTGQRFEETIYGKEVVFLYKFSYYYSLLSSGFKPLKIEQINGF